MESQPIEPTLSLSSADEAWDALADTVGEFVEAWDAGGDPPGLEQFLPEQPLALRRMTLIELIKVDLEYRWWDRKTPKPLEEYLEEFPELADNGPPVDLVYEEYHVRKKCGDDLQAEECLKRFPRHAEALRRLLNLQGEPTTAFFGQKSGQPPKVGDPIDDFDLLHELGKGAFASVFLARQQSMERLVALKISSQRSDEPQTLARLDHPHIVRVFDQRILLERNLC
ncbi:MAG: hypothetical protein N2C14_29765, partial [Planctomycetales bacterium]